MDFLAFDHNDFILFGYPLEMFRVFHEQRIDNIGCQVYGYVCLSSGGKPKVGISHGIKPGLIKPGQSRLNFELSKRGALHRTGREAILHIEGFHAAHHFLA